MNTLIIINHDAYNQLMDSANNLAPVAIMNGGSATATYKTALQTLIHELVHVRQWRNLGFDSFLSNYLLETIAKGYGSDSFEQEANAVETASAHLAARLAMTWVNRAHNSTLGTDLVGCDGCNPYSGDTACSEARPLLCIYPAGLANPGVATSSYYSWSGGYIAATAPIRGDAFGSLAAANAQCADSFGAGWRMAEFHDGDGGWNWYAIGNVTTGTRLWIYINDQKNAICWIDGPLTGW